MATQADDQAGYAAAEAVGPALLTIAAGELAGTRVAGYDRLPLHRGPLKHALLVGALFLGWIAYPGIAQRPALEWVVCYGAFVLLFDSFPRVSRRQIRLDLFNETRDFVSATALAAVAMLATRVVLTNDPDVAGQTLSIWLTTTIVLVPGRLALSNIELRHRRAGAAAQPTLIVGAGQVAQLTAKRLLEQPELGLRPVGFLDKTPLELNGASTPLPVLGASWDLEEVVSRYGIRQVIFTFSTAPHEVLLGMMARCHELGVAVSLVPRLFERMPTKVSIDHVGGLPLISIHPSNPSGWQFRVKYGVERMVAGGLVILGSPVFVASALAVWLSMGRPLLYRQRRVGRDGQEFEILKFRTMSEAPAEEGIPSLPPDTAPGGVEISERRTRVGKLMRRTSLDELPQLINVIRGEMSLVGPRPERPEFAGMFERDIYRYGERLRVKSGITGWAQVHGLRGQTSLSDRVEWDNHYIENWSFWLDVKILLRTIRIVFRFAGE
jgi:exopolysaccharide biosynthesis polyprenyl glycosylphosphotransferase